MMDASYIPPITPYEAAKWPSEDHHIVNVVEQGECSLCKQDINVALVGSTIEDEFAVCKYCATVIAMVIDRFEVEEAKL